jgi:hypothetical protein
MAAGMENVDTDEMAATDLGPWAAMVKPLVSLLALVKEKDLYEGGSPASPLDEAARLSYSQHEDLMKATGELPPGLLSEAGNTQGSASIEGDTEEGNEHRARFVAG